MPAWGGRHFPGEGLGTGFLSLEEAEPHALLFVSGRLNITYPMLFKLTNKNSDRMTHCGVLEFVADEGICYLPHWVSGPWLPRGVAGTPSACAQSCPRSRGRRLTANITCGCGHGAPGAGDGCSPSGLEPTAVLFLTAIFCVRLFLKQWSRSIFHVVLSTEF